MHAKIYQVIFGLYQVLRKVRYSILESLFGYSAHCPHTPSCGTLLMNAVKGGSIRLFVQSIKQVITCW